MTEPRFVPFTIDQINLLGHMAVEQDIPMSEVAIAMHGLIAKGLVSPAGGLTKEEEDFRFTKLIAELKVIEAERAQETK